MNMMQLVNSQSNADSAFLARGFFTDTFGRGLKERVSFLI